MFSSSSSSSSSSPSTSQSSQSSQSSSSLQIIPKIIHQLWIGPKPAPSKLMQTWKDKHPDFEYILWNEERIASHLPNNLCQKQLDMISEINGKADVYRWLILYEFGGYFFDADSICLEPIPEDFFSVPGNGFTCWENEVMREGLIACGSMGFIPQHPLLKKIIERIQTEETEQFIRTTRAWYSVGPGLITRAEKDPEIPKITVLPSYMFLPRHHTGLKYDGHEKIYAFQGWGTNDQSYDVINNMTVPEEYWKNPQEWVSVIITSYNTPSSFVLECLGSIQKQTGYFGIELVWVNDGSNEQCTRELKNILKVMEQTSRFIRVQYVEMPVNEGTRRASLKAIENCSHELIFKMDSDDVMLPGRLQKQMAFMKANPTLPLCGSQMNFMQNGRITYTTRHPQEWTMDDWHKSRPGWIMNHPTLCFRKTALLDIGNYTDIRIEKQMDNMMEDYELELKFLKKYGRLINLPESLVQYRIHPGQLTQQFLSETPEMIQCREQIIQRVFHKEEKLAKEDPSTKEVPSTKEDPTKEYVYL